MRRRRSPLEWTVRIVAAVVLAVLGVVVGIAVRGHGPGKVAQGRDAASVATTATTVPPATTTTAVTAQALASAGCAAVDPTITAAYGGPAVFHTWVGSSPTWKAIEALVPHRTDPYAALATAAEGAGMTGADYAAGATEQPFIDAAVALRNACVALGLPTSGG